MKEQKALLCKDKVETEVRHTLLDPPVVPLKYAQMIFDPSPTEIEPPLTPNFISPGLVFLTIVPDLANVT